MDNLILPSPVLSVTPVLYFYLPVAILFISCDHYANSLPNGQYMEVEIEEEKEYADHVVYKFRYVQRGLGYNKKEKTASKTYALKFPFKMDNKTFQYVVGKRMEAILAERNESYNVEAVEDYYDDYDFEFAKSGHTIPNFSEKHKASLQEQLKETDKAAE